VGSLLASLILGASLKAWNWRATVQLAPAITLASLALCSMQLSFGKTADKKGSNAGPAKAAAGGEGGGGGGSAGGEGGGGMTLAAARAKLWRIVSDAQWWRVNVASSCLLVSKGFEAYAAMYLGDVLKLSSSASGMMIAAIPAGIVASISFGG
jgi:hypothetical protein